MLYGWPYAIRLMRLDVKTLYQTHTISLREFGCIALDLAIVLSSFEFNIRFIIVFHFVRFDRTSIVIKNKSNHGGFDKKRD